MPEFDKHGRPRSAATLPGFRKGQKPGNYDKRLPPTLLQPDEVKRLMNACSVTAVGGVRNRALIAVLYRTGILISEALALKVEDIRTDNETVQIRGGFLQARCLGLDPIAAVELRKWLKRRRREAIAGDLVFCTYAKPNGGGKLGSPAVRVIFKRLATKAGLGETRVHPSAFRYSLAAELLIEGWPVPYIQTQLGLTTLMGMKILFDNLNLQLPSDEEVMAVVKTRPWDV